MEEGGRSGPDAGERVDSTDAVARLATGPEFGAAQAARVRSLAGEADWDALDALALRERLGALWHARLAGVAGVPAAFQASQRMRGLAAAGAATRAAADLAAVLDALCAGGVEVLAVKGPPLVEELFGDAALLPGADLDLLVRPDRVGDALRLLAPLGYRPVREPDAAWLRTFVEVELCHDGGGLPIDCHYHLGHARHFPVPDAYWWEGTRARELRGREVRVPGEEQAVLFAAMHLFKHSFRGLRHLAVFAAMLRSWGGRVDAERLLERARGFAADRSLLAAAHLAHALLAAPLAPPLAWQLHRAPARARRLLARLEREVLHPRRSGGAVRLAVMAWQHGAAGTALRLARWALPPAEEVRLRYDLPPGSRRLWWAYLANPARLIARRGR